MSPVSSLARRCAAGFVAAQLAFGAIAVGAVSLAAPAEAATFLTYHGAWQGVTTKIAGRPVFGARTDMSNGGTAAFVLLDGQLELMITNPKWNLKDGVTVPVSLTIDGTTYTGTGTSLGKDMIEMKNISRTVLGMFIDGAEAKLDVDNGSIVWTLDLHGFTASMADAARLIQASY